MKYLGIIVIGFFFIGCEYRGNEAIPSKDDVARWYSISQVKSGKKLFSNNCASCHGKEAQGVIHPWNQVLTNGKYPAPPLNGSAHPWHHPLDILRFTIKEGGKPMGGDMPSFKGILNDEEVDSIIAYFQSHWSNEIYDQWNNISGLKDK